MENDIQDIIVEMLQNMQFTYSKVEVELEEDGRTYRVNIEAEDSNLLIGKHGENMQAFQSIAKLITYRKFPENKDFSITIDVDNYRKRQEESVIAIANRKADYVRQTGKAQSLPPMSAYFRRVVHMYLMQPEFDDLETESHGQGNFRKVMIKMAV